MAISITGITQRQRDFLDIMWACETYEDYLVFIASLPKDLQHECELLSRLIILASIDEEVEDSCLFEANQVLEKFRL